MKIAVVSLYINDWYREITKYGRKTLEIYCKNHSYDFYWETETSEFYDKRRDCPWYKILMILKILKHKKKYDFVVWNDADSLVIRDKYSFEEIINTYMSDTHDILVSHENNCVLNTGTMFIRNTNWSVMFLYNVWYNENNFNKEFHEQASMGQLYETNFLNCQKKIKILTNKFLFLSYWSEYNLDTFILHITRCSHDRQGFIFSMDAFTPIKMEEETINNYEKRLKFLNDPKIYSNVINHYLNGGKRLNITPRLKK